MPIFRNCDRSRWQIDGNSLRHDVDYTKTRNLDVQINCFKTSPGKKIKMALVELASLLNAYVRGEITEMDIRLELFMFPYSDETEYAYSIIGNLRRVTAYVDYIERLVYHERQGSDDSDDTL